MKKDEKGQNIDKMYDFLLILFYINLRRSVDFFFHKGGW